MREREATPHSRKPQERAAEPPRKRRRWLRIALVLVAALAALVAFAPQILSTGFVKNFLFARVGARVGMRISADELRLAWFGSQAVHGLAVESTAGEPLARVASVRLDQGLLALLAHWPRIGGVVIEDGETTPELLGILSAARAAEAEKPAEAPAPEDAGPEAAAPVLPESIRIRNLTLRTGAGTLRLLEADFVAGATKDAFEARLEIASGEATGAASLDAEIEGLSHDWRGGDALGVTVRARCENLALAPIWGAIPRAGDGLSLAGTVSGTATVRREREGKLTISTQWDGRDLSAAGDLLGGDRPALGKVRLVFDGDYEGRTLTVRNLAFDSPVAQVKGQGTFDLAFLDPAFGGDLALPVTGQGTASLEVALAPLTQMLRHTLRLHEDLVVQSGNLSASLEAKADEAALALQLAAAVANLQGMRAGRPVAFAPFSISADLERGKDGVAAKDIRLAAGFGSVTGKGRIEDFTLDASLDLAKATEDLGQFVDLAGRGANGSVRLHLETRGTFAQGVDLAASADAADLSVALGDGRQWAEPRITFATAAHADFDAERRLAALAVTNLTLAASAGTVEATGTAARNDPAWTVTGDAKGAGDVGILARQVAAYLGRPATAIAGQWRLNAEGQATPGKSFAVTFAARATGLKIPVKTDGPPGEGEVGKALTLQDASLSAEVAYDSAKGRLVTVRSLRVEAPGLRAKADGSATLPGQDETGRLHVNGEGDVQADLAALAPVLEPFGLLTAGSRMAGKVTVHGSAASDAKGTSGEANLAATDLDLYFADKGIAIRTAQALVKATGTYTPETQGANSAGVDLSASAEAKGLIVAPGEERRWSEPRISLVTSAHVDVDAERRLAALAVKNLALTASAGTVEASGTAARNDPAWTVTGNAKGAGDVAVLARQVAAYLGRPATGIAGQWRLEAKGQATPGKSYDLFLTGGATGLAMPIQTGDPASAEGQTTKTLTLQDASLSAEVAYDSAKERLVTVRGLRVEAPGLQAKADGSATLPGPDETGRVRVNGEGNVQADLAVLARTLQPFGLLAPGSRMAGKVVLRGKAASDDKGTAGEGNLEATDLDLYFAETESAIREPRALAQVTVGYAPEAKRWTIDTKELTSALAKGRATAALTPNDASLGVEAQADLTCDGAKLRALIGNRLPADLALSGGWRAVAAVRGPIADEAPTWNRKIAGLSGEGRIEIDSATFRGLKATAGTIPWNLAGGKLVLSPNADDPARITVNEGTVTPAGTIDLAPEEPRYVLAGPAPLAKDVHLTGELAEKMLSYLSPLVGQSISPTGRLSLTAEKADIPLGASVRQAATFLGDFTIEDFEGRLKGPLAILATWTGTQGEVEKQTLGPFPIRLENGLFHLEDQKVRLRRGIEFRLDGTIALDGTMETTVGIPLTEDLLKKAGVPVRAGGEQLDRLVRIPLKGTVKHPKLDEARIPIEILKTVGDLFLGGEKDIEKIGDLLKDVFKKREKKESEPPAPAPDNPPPADGQTKPPPEEPTLKDLIDLFRKPKDKEPPATP